MSILSTIKETATANKVGSIAGSQKNQIAARTFILQAGRFIEVAQKYMESRVTPRSDSQEWDGNRERLRRVEWPLQSLLGNADEEIWAAIIAAALAGMEKQIRNAQNNGQWRITEYEVDLTTNTQRNQQVIELGVRWVDSSGNDDQSYRDGKPISVNVHVDAPAMSQAVMDRLATSGDDPELKDLLRGLIAVMAVREGAVDRADAEAMLAATAKKT
tara:strand:- start:164 stop:811 length:648 start_codon:yes stop_codon:yes gene_type:complete